jgi:hypothetical protein
LGLSDEKRAKAWKQINSTATTKKALLNTETEETVLEKIARRIHDRHPTVRRCGMAEVTKQLRAIARRVALGKGIELLHRIDRNHAAWCASQEWQDDGGKYAKGLANWLAPTIERWNEPPSSSISEQEPPRLMM